MAYLGWLFVGLLIGSGVTIGVSRWLKSVSHSGSGQEPVSWLLRKHFHPLDHGETTISGRQFPFRVRADLQRAIDRLASRPGRIDQAIEFPLPDEEGRRKLVVLYSQGIAIPESVIHEAVRRTEEVSAAFIKKLMRRTVQFHIERDGAGEVSHEDLNSALDEMLFSGGSLNLKLLGARLPENDCPA